MYYSLITIENLPKQFIENLVCIRVAIQYNPSGSAHLVQGICAPIIATVRGRPPKDSMRMIYLRNLQPADLTYLTLMGVSYKLETRAYMKTLLELCIQQGNGEVRVYNV